jgi:cysteine desulfurase/selenocysteine lyase
MPIMQRFGVPATARVSLGFYNTKEEMDVLCSALGRVLEVFR